MSPQAEVLYHVIAQPNSRDAVHSMLGMNRQVNHHHPRLLSFTNSSIIIANATLFYG